MITKIPFAPADARAATTIAIDPATQIDDFFDYSKAVVKKPWGYEYLMYQNGVVAVWILYIKQGFQTSTHCHPHKKTSLIVLWGEALCGSLQQQVRCTPGDGLLIDKGVFHSTKSVSEGGIFVMEIETPINKRDLLRLEDHYGRVGKGYESVKEMSFNLQNYNYISLIDSSIHYNNRRKFGNCGISLAAFTTIADFQKNFDLQKWDAACILKGSIIDENGNLILTIGDTIDIQLIKSSRSFNITSEIEVITIKRQDAAVKLSDYVASFLEKKGITPLFVVPGSSTIHLLDSIGRNTNVQHFVTQTEHAAALAAEGYAKLTGKIAAAIIPTGSSAIQALTAVANAWVDSTPLLIISGQTRSDQMASGTLRQLGVQELNFIDMVKAITKYAVRVVDPTTIRYHLEKAFFLAQQNRLGPVWVEFPLDLQGMDINEAELIPFQLDIPSHLETSASSSNFPSNLIVERVLNDISQAKRPVLLVGNGIRLAKVEQELLQLIDALGIPVLTSRRGADLLPENHPLFFGRPGAYGQRSANFIIQNSDLLLSIGCRLSLTLLGRNYKAFAQGAKKIIIDIDQAELEKATVKADVALNFSADAFIKAMLTALKQEEVQLEKKIPASDGIADWLHRCQQWKQQYAREGSTLSASSGINAYHFMESLAAALPEGDIICVDGGLPNILAMQAFSFKKNQRLISATGLENTSFAIPAGIGCCIGASGKSIICICEEQGLQKNVSELGTILQHQLPLKIFVLNTHGNSYMKESQREYFGGRYVASEASDEQIHRSTEIAKVYGISTLQINSADEISSIIQKAIQTTGPVICEINVDQEQQIIPRLTFTVKPDGKWIAKPLEDMYPYLDRKEFKENMIIEPLEENEL